MEAHYPSIQTWGANSKNTEDKWKEKISLLASKVWEMECHNLSYTPMICCPIKAYWCSQSQLGRGSPKEYTKNTTTLTSSNHPCHLKQEMQSPSSALSNNLAQRGLQGNCTCTLCIPCHLAMLPIINDCKYQPCTIAPKSDTPTLPPISHLREIHEPHPRGYTLCTRGEFVTHSLDPIGHVSDLPSELNHGLSQI